MTLNRIQEERDRRISNGHIHCTIHKLEQLYIGLGYKFDRSMDCRGNASYVTCPYAGISYPALTLYPIQIDNGLSAWNVDARRDDNFKAMQAMRNTHFAVSPNAIVEV